MKISYKIIAVISILLMTQNYEISYAATPKPKVKVTAKATSKPTTKTTTKKTTTTQKTITKSGINISNFGYVGRRDKSDMDIEPIVKQLAGTALDDNGAVFKLPDVASAKKVLDLIISDLSEANIKCEVIDPNLNPLIPLVGSSATDTLAACKHGDPSDGGFIEYVITDKNFVSKYSSSEYVKQYLNFQTPIKGSGEQTQFTPSLRAILLVVGGEYAFDASEISWAVLYNQRFEPPQRTATTQK